MIVLSWSKATRDLLKSFGWGIRALHQLDAATMVPSPRRLPHTISPLEEAGFEPSAPRVMGGDLGRRVPALIAVFELAGTAVALQRATDGSGAIRDGDPQPGHQFQGRYGGGRAGSQLGTEPEPPPTRRPPQPPWC